MSEIAEQEDGYAQGLEESRGVLKGIRNVERSTGPTREAKQKVADEIQKLKWVVLLLGFCAVFCCSLMVWLWTSRYKEPQSAKIVELEQELVRAEAQSLVAEAQLTNVVRLTVHPPFPDPD